MTRHDKFVFYSTPQGPMTEQELEQAAQEFWEQVELEAARSEVTVDYYLAEFFCS